MKTYIGVRAVQAEREDRAADMSKPPEERGVLEGYKVVHPNGSETWAPKAEFEEACVEVPEAAAEIIVEETRSRAIDLALIATDDAARLEPPSPDLG